MKLTWILCVCFVCTVSANVMSQQKLSMNLGETSIKKVFEEIRKQTNKVVIYNDDRLTMQQKVTANFKDVELAVILEQILVGSGMTYKFVDDYILITPVVKVEKDSVRTIRVRGQVCDTKKTPLPGVTVMVKGLTLGVATNTKGEFSMIIPNPPKNLSLIFSATTRISS